MTLTQKQQQHHHHVQTQIHKHIKSENFSGLHIHRERDGTPSLMVCIRTTLHNYPIMYMINYTAIMSIYMCSVLCTSSDDTCCTLYFGPIESYVAVGQPHNGVKQSLYVDLARCGGHYSPNISSGSCCWGVGGGQQYIPIQQIHSIRFEGWVICVYVCFSVDMYIMLCAVVTAAGHQRPAAGSPCAQ